MLILGNLMGFDFVDGRIPTDSTEVAVSEAFVKRMADFADWSDGAVGKQVLITGHGTEGMGVLPFTISGVYRDIRINNLVDLDTRPSVRFYGSLDDGKSYMPYVVLFLYS